ncbi:amidohydrolase family protein [Crocinitomix algicola]|uniref:amidohydrolase family protein n=1 Tax=Crocinitomix algicola TaxID=1740263 RepID=UPI00082AF104|nr:amidohydrolase family protein [Crocinitomix algicola]
MNIFDFNVHLQPIGDQNVVHDKLAQEGTLFPADTINFFTKYWEKFKSLKGLNLMIFNKNYFHDKDENIKLMRFLDAHFESHTFTYLIDFRDDNWKTLIDNASENGVKFIKFHCYFMCLTAEYHDRGVEISQYAASKKIGIVICTSFGTSAMYSIDSMSFACKVADQVNDVPIILLHSGGARIHHALLLALDKPNIYLETSFTLPFYVGSSLEKDFAFCYKKLGIEKVLFASDHPYVDINHAIQENISFFERHHFSKADTQAILFENAKKLISSF